MKRSFLILLFLPFVGIAQKDYCKKITKDNDKNNNTVTYKSPDLKDLEVIKQFNSSIFFVLHLHFKVESQHFDSKGILVEFEDGSTVQDEEAVVNCKEELAIVGGGDGHNSISHSEKYLLQGFLHINEGNIQKFLNKKIVRVQLHTVSQKIHDKEATQIMNYIKCLQDRKE